MCAHIGELKKSVFSVASICKMSASDVEKDSGTVGIASKTQEAVKPPSYASVASGDISKAVKLAVTETFNKQRKSERDSATVAVYGLKENNRDQRDLYDAFVLLGCNAKIDSYVRLGRARDSDGKAEVKSRMLKVTLRSISDRDDLLSAVKGIKRFPQIAHLRVSKWMQPDELKKIKLLRQQCFRLNQREPVLADGRVPYVVISGRLMSRLSSGKLKPVNITEFNTTPTARSRGSSIPCESTVEPTAVQLGGKEIGRSPSSKERASQSKNGRVGSLNQ
jgi:hypothetical protein